MSTTVKKESTKKKSTKSEEAEAVVVEAEEAKAPAKRTAPAKKTATSKTTAAKTTATKATATKATATKTAATKAAAAQDEPEVIAEEPVKKTRGRKPKAAETVPAEEEPVKKTRASTTRKSKTAEEAEPATEAVEGEVPAPKRKYTRKAKADDAEADNAAVDSDIGETAAPAKKPGRKSKKDKEAEAAESDDGADIETRVYNLIKDTPGGVYQNEIWKQLSIDSRKCSRILKKLLDSDQIIREEAVSGGTKTYLLKTVAEERKRNYDVLMVKGMFSPCTGCIGECRPEYCPALTFWIMNLHETPEQLYAAMGYNSDAAEPEHGEVEMPPEFLEEMEADEYEFADEDDGDLVFD